MVPPHNATVDVPGYGPVPFDMWWNPSLCTIDKCPPEWRKIKYFPSLAGNSLYLAIFAIALALQIFFGIRHRTWGFMAGMILGLLLEILGYVSRIELHNNIFDDNWFKIYLIGLTIGPALLSGAIYLCLSRVMVVYGRSIPRFRPAVYTITFMCFDLFSLILQAVGGALASTASSNSGQQSGINIMIAGLAFQVISLFLFLLMCADFAVAAYGHRANWDPAHATLRGTTRFKALLLSLLAATLFIFVRSCYRVAELKQGFDGKLANQQVSFMILEGAMVVLAVILLTALHPGVAFQGSWREANFSLRASRDKLRGLKQGGGEEKAGGSGQISGA